MENYLDGRGPLDKGLDPHLPSRRILQPQNPPHGLITIT